MKVVSVINYKGGVGKTTVTANLAAGVAATGRKVLAIDLDPQASLTFSLIRPETWKSQFEASRTIKRWYDSFSDQKPTELSTYAMKPKRVTAALKHISGTGSLELVPSHLGLINVDLELAAEMGGGSLSQNKKRYIRVHRRLADELSKPYFGKYDVILIDCPPNFNIITKTAIVASDRLLIPAKADYLSTLGIDYLDRSVKLLIDEYNEYAEFDTGAVTPPIQPDVLGVVFTMIQYYADQPIAALRPFIQQTRNLDVPVFAQMVRENKTFFGDAPEAGVPLAVDTRPQVRNLAGELGKLVNEFIRKLGV